MQKNKTNSQAFTIFELTIVLGIVAFLIGVIVSADSLIKNSQVRSIISDVTAYKGAVKLFEEKYGNLPGDIAASNIWSGANNGNQDGRIGDGSGTDISSEPTYAWQHLNLAKLISFTQVGSSYLPSSRVDGSFYVLYDQKISTPLYNRVGTYLSLSGSSIYSSGITRTMATQIDLKIDDGLPSNGMVYAARGSDMSTSCSGTSCSCVTSYWSSATWSSFTSPNYAYGDVSKSCRMIFWLKELN